MPHGFQFAGPLTDLPEYLLLCDETKRQHLKRLREMKVRDRRLFTNAGADGLHFPVCPISPFDIRANIK